MNDSQNTDRTSFAKIPLDDTVKGILIDLDNTLYEYDPCHEEAMKTVHAKHHAPKGISYEDFISSYDSAKKKVKSRIPGHGASHSRLLYFQQLTEQRYGKTDIVEAINSDQTYWKAYHAAVKLREDAVSFLRTCKEKGIPICLITDLTASVQFHKIVAIGAEGLFDLIVTSEEAGVEKPDGAIFALALEKLGLPPEDVIMIGDDKRKDIDGAEAIGIKAYMV